MLLVLSLLVFLFDGSCELLLVILPSQQGAGPSKSATEGGEANKVTWFYFTFFPSLTKRYRNGGRRGIPVLLDIVVYLVVAQF